MTSALRRVWRIERRVIGRAAAVAVAMAFCPMLAGPGSPSPLRPAAAQQNDPAHQQFLFAYKLLQRGDDQMAADAFDDYLGKFPRDAKRGDGLYYRALLFRRAGRNDMAAGLLEDVPEPQIVPAYAVDLLKGQVLADLQRHEEAVVALRRIDTEALEPKVAVSVLYLRGLAQRGAENLPAAAVDLEAAAELDSPMRGRALLDLARVQVLMGREQEAVTTLSRAMRHTDATAAAEAARMAGDISYNNREYDRAVELYGRVLDRHQGSRHFGAAVIGTLWSHYSAGRYRQVLEVFDRHRTALPVQDRVAAWYLAGSAQQDLGEHERAVQLFDQVAHGEGRVPLQDKVLYKLAASQFELGRFDQMTRTVERLRTQFPDSDVAVDAAFLLAAADARRGNVAQGAARLTQIVDQGPQSPYYLQALLRRARMYENHDRLDAAADDYFRFLEGSTIPSVGQRPDGQPLLRPTQIQAGAFLRLLDVYQRLNRHELTAGLAKRWLDTKRLEPLVEQEAMYRRALALVRVGNSNDALAVFERLEQQHPLSPFSSEVSYYRGLLLLSLDRADQAVPLLERAADNEELARPLRVNALRLVALRQRNTGGAAAAAETLRRIESLADVDQFTDAELLWMARHLVEAGEASEAMRYTRPLVEGRPGASSATRAEALYLAGRAHRAAGRLDDAERLFQQVVAMGHGFDLESQLELAKVTADRGHFDEAGRQLEGLIRSEASAIAAEALFTAASFQRELAAKHRRAENREGVRAANLAAQHSLKRLVLLYPFRELEPMPQLAYLELADIAVELDELDAAARELRELVEKYPDGPFAVYARAVLAADANRRAEAQALIRSLSGAELHPKLRHRVDELARVLEVNR
jgi:tetratricopeptide (TPR) repeat protein